MLLLLPGRRPAGPLVAGIGLYAVGKLAEVGDGPVLALGGLVSGHTLKHLLAAAAAVLIVRWLVSPEAEPDTRPDFTDYVDTDGVSRPRPR
jgi:hypothetical protein